MQMSRRRRQPIGADLDSEGGKKSGKGRKTAERQKNQKANMQMQHKEGCPEYDPW